MDFDLADEDAVDALQIELFDSLPLVPMDAHFSPSAYSDILVAFAQLLVELGDFAVALTLAEETLRVRELTMPAGHWRLAEARAVLGYALARQGDHDKGHAMLTEAATFLIEKRGAQSLPAKVAQDFLADCALKTEPSAVP